MHAVTAPVAVPGQHRVEVEYCTTRGEVVWPHQDLFGVQVRRLGAVRVAPGCAGVTRHEAQEKSKEYKGSSTLWNPIPDALATSVTTEMEDEKLLVLASLSRTQNDTIRSNVTYRLRLKASTEPCIDERLRLGKYATGILGVGQTAARPEDDERDDDSDGDGHSHPPPHHELRQSEDLLPQSSTNTGCTKNWNLAATTMVTMAGGGEKVGEHTIDVMYKTCQSCQVQWSHDAQRGPQETSIAAIRVQGSSTTSSHWGGEPMDPGLSQLWADLPTPMALTYSTTTPGSMLFVAATLSRVSHAQGGCNVCFRITVDDREVTMNHTGDVSKSRFTGVSMMGVTGVAPGAHDIRVEYMTQAGEVLFPHDPDVGGGTGLGEQYRQIMVTEVSPFTGMGPGGVINGYKISDHSNGGVQGNDGEMVLVEQITESPLTVTGRVDRGWGNRLVPAQMAHLREWEIRAYTLPDPRRGLYVRQDHIWYKLGSPARE
jgi:hypothetical protein